MIDSFHEVVVMQWCDSPTLQPEKLDGQGSTPSRAQPLERDDKVSRTRLGLLYGCSPSAWAKN